MTDSFRFDFEDVGKLRDCLPAILSGQLVAFRVDILDACVRVGQLVEFLAKVFLDESGHEPAFEPEPQPVRSFRRGVDDSEALPVQVGEDAWVLRLRVVGIVMLYLADEITDDGPVLFEGFLGLAVDVFEFESANREIPRMSEGRRPPPCACTDNRPVAYARSSPRSRTRRTPHRLYALA